MDNQSNFVNVLGVRINRLTKEDFLRSVDRLVVEKKPVQITTVNPEFLVAAQRGADFKSVLLNSDINTADGIGVLWAAKFLSLHQTKIFPLSWIQAMAQLFFTVLTIPFRRAWLRSVIPERLSGSELIYAICNLAQEKGYSVFFLGGFGDTPELVKKRMTFLYPKLKIAGAYGGAPDEPGLIDKINRSQTDILLVAYGPVVQEVWLSDNLKNLQISVGIGLGGTFDYVAGNKPSAPRFLREKGLEWAWRLVTQPYRLARIYNAVLIFPWYCLLQKIINQRPFRKNVVGCLINKNNQVLICKRAARAAQKIYDEFDMSKEHWQLPQGGVNENESDEEAVLREVKEETSVDRVDIIAKIEKASTYDWPVKLALKTYGSRYRGQTQSLFYLRLKEHNPKILLEAAEFSEYKWVSPEELPQILHPVRKALAKTILENWPEKTTRHD